MKAKNIFIIVSSVIALTTVFCLVCESVSAKTDEETVYNITETYSEEYSDDNFDNFYEYEEKTTCASVVSTTVKETYKSTTTKTNQEKPKTTNEHTTKTTTYAKSRTQECEEALVNGDWNMDNGNKWDFIDDGRLYIYDSNNKYLGLYYYDVSSYKISIYTYDGEFCAVFEYNPYTNRIECVYSAYEETVTTCESLNNSNAYYYLADAIEAYSGFIHTNSNNFEFDYNTRVTCPHCSDFGYYGEAWRLVNFTSLTEIEEYINANLTGCAREWAIGSMNELIDNGMIFEYNGNLYVCSMYNEKGYNGLDPETVEVYGTCDDGSYLITVEEYTFADEIEAETFYYIVVYEDGAYKISSDAHVV